jgi:hypothetical protein
MNHPAARTEISRAPALGRILSPDILLLADPSQRCLGVVERFTAELTSFKSLVEGEASDEFDVFYSRSLSLRTMKFLVLGAAKPARSLTDICTVYSG